VRYVERATMASAGIHGVELVILLLMVLMVALAALAKRLETPYPIVMVIGGLIISFVPSILGEPVCFRFVYGGPY
jgi:monovalent cation/hydrogen antiporter